MLIDDLIMSELKLITTSTHKRTKYHVKFKSIQARKIKLGWFIRPRNSLSLELNRRGRQLVMVSRYNQAIRHRAAQHGRRDGCSGNADLQIAAIRHQRLIMTTVYAISVGMMSYLATTAIMNIFSFITVLLTRL